MSESIVSPAHEPAHEQGHAALGIPSDAPVVPDLTHTVAPRLDPAPATDAPVWAPSSIVAESSSPAADDGELPWWWFGVFLLLFVVFAILVVILVALGQNLVVAVGVPGTLSGVAIVALSRIAKLSSRRRQG